MSTDIVQKVFYLSSLFSDLKSNHSWTVNEVKVVLLILAELSKHKIYIPDLLKNKDLSNEAIFDELRSKSSLVPVDFVFTRQQFQAITEVDSPNLAREIKKVGEGLLKKIIFTPHPLEKNKSKSYVGITWFRKIEYLDDAGEIKVKINEEIIERLVAFIKYTRIDFHFVTKIKNSYAINIYLFAKILMNSSKLKSLVMSVTELKDKLNLSGSGYERSTNLKAYVLEVIKTEINAHTDLVLDYELIKEGRAYTQIKFTFDYKPGLARDPELIEGDLMELPDLEESVSTKTVKPVALPGEQSSLLQNQEEVKKSLALEKEKQALESFGFSPKRANKILGIHGETSPYFEINVVEAIHAVKEAIKTRDIKNKMSYFITVLEDYEAYDEEPSESENTITLWEIIDGHLKTIENVIHVMAHSAILDIPIIFSKDEDEEDIKAKKLQEFLDYLTSEEGMQTTKIREFLVSIAPKGFDLEEDLKNSVKSRKLYNFLIQMEDASFENLLKNLLKIQEPLTVFKAFQDPLGEPLALDLMRLSRLIKDQKIVTGSKEDKLKALNRTLELKKKAMTFAEASEDIHFFEVALQTLQLKLDIMSGKAMTDLKKRVGA